MTTKVCSKCEIEKDILELYIRNNKPHSACKICDIARQKLFRQTQPERNKTIAKKYRGKPKRRFANAKRVASKRGLLWSISFEEYLNLITQPCYYCNFEFGKPIEVGSGLDRLDNFNGYELSNVVSCCGACNLIRNHFLTPEEMKVAMLAVIAYRKCIIMDDNLSTL